MMNSPWAMLITPIWPKVSASPSAINSRIEPWETPANNCPTTMSMAFSLSVESCR